MTTRGLTLAGFALLAVVAAALAVAGRAGRFGLVAPGELLDALRAPVPARLAIVLAWAWLGWHLLAR